MLKLPVVLIPRLDGGLTGNLIRRITARVRKGGGRLTDAFGEGRTAVQKHQRPKVVVIGAGSLFFGRQAIWQMAHSPHLNTGTLGLIDSDPVHLEKMAALARKVVAHTGVELRIEASCDPAAVLPGADFVVLSFADHSVRYRGLDCAIALKYGVRMCSGDTIGPGGIMRVLREFPVILAYAKQIERQCPDAWVINYINPTAANGIGLRLFAPRLKSFALCDGLHMPHVKREYAARAGIIRKAEDFTAATDRNFDFRIAGPNHFTWLLKAAYKGRDVAPAIARALRKAADRETAGDDADAKTRFNETISYALYECFGYVPTCTAHTKEYVRFWQGLGKTPETVPPLSIWETGDRYERHAAMWAQVDSFNYGLRPIADFMKAMGPDHATDIVETMWADLKKPFFINTANGDTVPNLPADAFLEMLCDLSMDGPKPRPIGPAPVGLRGLWQQVLDTHELSVRAAVTGSRDTLLQAFLCDPLVSSVADAKAMIAELLRAERKALPAIWFR
jgi:alpha-galactosidase